jgi:hypothetical protein
MKGTQILRWMFLFLSILLSPSQQLFSTKLHTPNIPCSGNSSICYEKLMVPLTLDMLSTVPIARFHINSVLEVRDLCSTVTNMIGVAQNATVTNFTCIDYFCSGSSPNLISLVLDSRAVLDLYIDNPKYIRKPVQNAPSLKDWIQPHFDMVNYCYYCNHSSRDQFHSLISNYSCPYFWHHSSAYGNDGKNKQENPTLLSSMHAEYIVRKQSQLANRDPMSNLTDFLYLTSLRTRDHDEISEENLREYPYFVYCSSWNMFAVYCDAFQWFVNPLYSAWIIIDVIVRLIILVIIFVVLTVPRIAHFARITSTRLLFVREVIFDLKNQCIFWTSIAIFAIIIEDIREYDVRQAWFMSTGGVWRIITVSSSLLGFGVLLILWSHIFHSSNSMDGGEKLNKWNRGLMIFLYGSVFIGFSLPVLLIIILSVVQPFLKFEMISYMFIFVIAFVLILEIGFFFYGLRMFHLLKRSSENVKFYKVKFTKFMMVMLVLLFHYLFWLSVVAVEYGRLAGRMGLFIHMWKAQFLDASLMIMYPVLIYMLYENKRFWEFGPYAKLRARLVQGKKKGDYEMAEDEAETNYVTMPSE